jgi:hypothetical protein
MARILGRSNSRVFQTSNQLYNDYMKALRIYFVIFCDFLRFDASRPEKWGYRAHVWSRCPNLGGFGEKPVSENGPHFAIFGIKH